MNPSEPNYGGRNPSETPNEPHMKVLTPKLLQGHINILIIKLHLLLNEVLLKIKIYLLTEVYLLPGSLVTPGRHTRILHIYMGTYVLHLNNHCQSLGWCPLIYKSMPVLGLVP